MSRVTSVKTKRTAEFGDFQTPLALARLVCQSVLQRCGEPASVVEPTCGKGSFLVAARDVFPTASKILGADINAQYVEEARLAAGPAVEVRRADFFTTDWQTVLAPLPEPLFVIGNLPWVTNAELGSLGSDNLPAKVNARNLAGLDAMTGKSNFDISEWMLLRLFDALKGRHAVVSMLCKTTVARKTLLHAWKEGVGFSDADVRLIDAAEHFGAAVDACCLTVRFSSPTRFDCSVFDSLEAPRPMSTFGFRDGRLIADLDAHERTKCLEGQSLYRWRSGVKHDCSAVMEFRREGERYRNGLGELVDIEDTFLFPMFKSSELTRGPAKRPTRFMLVPQRVIGEDTGHIRDDAPATWDYLLRHGDALDRRGSSVYKGRPRFSVFGVGDYSFSEWKVAISGFYKRLDFCRVGPWQGKPIVLDDTAYFLPCETEAEATLVEGLLNSETAKDFFSAHVFWDAKRPITIAMLKLLDIHKLASKLGREDELKNNAHTREQREFAWSDGASRLV